MTINEKLTIAQGICTPLLRKIKADLLRNIEDAGGVGVSGEEAGGDEDDTVHRLNQENSSGVSSEV